MGLWKVGGCSISNTHFKDCHVQSKRQKKKETKKGAERSEVKSFKNNSIILVVSALLKIVIFCQKVCA